MIDPDGRVRRFVPLVPAAVVLSVVLSWTADEGGYSPFAWYPGLLLLLGLIVVTAIGLRVRWSALPRPHRIAVGTLAAYVFWSFLSTTWAAAPGDALEGSNRALLYLASFGLFMVMPWTDKTGAAFFLIWTLGIAVIAGVTVVGLATAAHASAYLLDGRLASPISYPNADAALFGTAALLGVFFGSRSSLPAPLRGLLVASAAMLVELAILTQSRGWLFTLPAITAAAIAVVPRRLRLIAFCVPPMIAIAALLPWLLGVYRAGSLVEPTTIAGARAASAARAILIAAPLTFVVAAAMAVIEKRINWSAAHGRRVAVAVVCALVVASGAVVGWTLGADTHGHTRRVDRGAAVQQEPTHRLIRYAQLGSARYDIWRVAVRELIDHPLGGLGQDNFAEEYLAKRRVLAQPRWVHSLELRLLTHTGIIGFLLFVLFLGLTIRAVLYRPTQAPDGERARVNGEGARTPSMLALAVWLMAGSVDWLWEFPALSVPVFAGVGLASAATSRPIHHAAHPSMRRRAEAGVAAIVVILAFMVVTAPYLAQREIASAVSLAAADPKAAIQDLHAATALNPLSEQAHIIAAVLALRTREWQAARAEFTNAIAVDSQDWFAYFERGLLEQGTRIGAARSDLIRAMTLNPAEQLIREALLRLGSRNQLGVSTANAMLAPPTQPGPIGTAG